jgi:hypothetical protein
LCSTIRKRHRVDCCAASGAGLAEAVSNESGVFAGCPGSALVACYDMASDFDQSDDKGACSANRLAPMQKRHTQDYRWLWAISCLMQLSAASNRLLVVAGANKTNCTRTG